MKKSLKFVLSALFVFVLANETNAQALREGNFILDVYYGAPNFGKSLISSIEESNPEADVKANGIGPLGLRGEYMLGDRIGLGFDAIYNSNGIEYSEQTIVYNSETGQSETISDDIVGTQRRLRVHLRFNYHFDISTPELDAYLGVGAGTNNRWYTETVNGVEDSEASVSGTLFPMSARICTGMRYYFSENIGLNAEIGLGGPLVSAGLSIKL